MGLMRTTRHGCDADAMTTRCGCALPVVPEMAYFDFTYVDDIVEGIVRVMQKAPVRNGTKSIMVSERK